MAVFLVIAAGCFSTTQDKNGNPYRQVPGEVTCSWLTQKTVGCPEIIGPVQTNSFGQACQTFKQGTIYETRCDRGVLQTPIDVQPTSVNGRIRILFKLEEHLATEEEAK
jgi:hypothetical protein